jgi:hypothetical protein
VWARSVSATLDTTFIPPRDREEAVRHAVWESVVRIDIGHHPPPKDISVRVKLNTVGCIGICLGQATGLTIRQTQRLAQEDAEPSVFLGLQMTGPSLVAQNDRQALRRSSPVCDGHMSRRTEPIRAASSDLRVLYR